MSILTHLMISAVSDGETVKTGKTLTKPALTYTDGVNVTYCVDVDIGREGVINENGDIGTLPLYGVPIASNNHALIYAAVGSAVTVTRAKYGRWEVTGFAKTYTGTMMLVEVQLPLYCLRIPTEHLPGDPIVHPPIIGVPIDISVNIRRLTYDELSLYGGYGTVPYGASARFIGGVFDKLI